MQIALPFTSRYAKITTYHARVHHNGVARLGLVDRRLKRVWLGIALVAENLDLLDVKTDNNSMFNVTCFLLVECFIYRLYSVCAHTRILRRESTREENSKLLSR